MSAAVLSGSLASALAVFGVVPVVEIDDAEDAASLGRALTAAGLPVVEITLRTPAALAAIRAMRAAFPDLLVGAGTILSPDDADAAADAGAHFLVAPGFTQSVVDRAAELSIELVPGAATPSEIERAREAGFRLLKFFPAVPSGGLDMIRALSGPYRDVRFMPTGGIRAENLREWLDLPAVAACGGTWIAPRDLIAAGRFAEIEDRARAAAELTTPPQEPQEKELP